MEKTTQTFEVEIETAIIIERFYDIIDENPKELRDFLDNYEDEVRKYAKDKLDMIDYDEASEHCNREHVDRWS